MAKASSVANRIIEQCHKKHNGDINLTKLQKLAYYVQGWHLAVFGDTAFNDEIEAWQYGPVVPSLYHRFKYLSGVSIPEEHQYANANYEDLTPEQIHLIDQIVDAYGSNSAGKLVELTHKKGTPWANVYQPNHAGITIPVDLIESYFKQFRSA